MPDARESRAGAAVDAESLHIIAERTGRPQHEIQPILEAQLRYEVLLGMSPPEAIEDDEFDLEEERERHAGLVPPELLRIPMVRWDLERAFIQRITKASADVIFDVLSSQLACLAQQGLIDPSATEGYRAWAETDHG
jgi:hypothetical protein